MKLKQSDFSYKQIYFYQIAILGATQEGIKILKLRNDIFKKSGLWPLLVFFNAISEPLELESWDWSHFEAYFP